MFQFPWFSSLTYVFSQGLHGMTRVGLPHSGISGSTPVSGFPKLIATCYALHRPLTPRNPPQALKRLTKILSSATSNYIQLSKNSALKGHFLKSLFCSRLANSGVWRWTGSNRWPPACKAGALPTELHPQLTQQFGFKSITKKRNNVIKFNLFFY